MRRVVVGVIAVLALFVSSSQSYRSAAAALNPAALALSAASLPAGAFITHQHVDRTATAVDAEGLVGTPSRQGDFYAQLHFSGSLFESARLPRAGGAERQVWLLATIFPSSAEAFRALSADAHFNECDLSVTIAALPHAVTCAYINTAGPESGMYVLNTVGRVEFIVVAFIHAASSTARHRAVRDATYTAQHEAEHVEHLLRLGEV